MTYDLVAEYRAAVAAGLAASPADGSGGLDALDPQMLAQAGEALRAWASSPEGRAIVVRARELPPEEAAESLSAAFESPDLGAIIAKILKKVPLKAVSVGLLGQVELIVGIAGSIGYAIDLGNLGETRAIYAGGGLIEGVDLGGEAAVVLGLWAETTSQINGFYVGAGMDITEGVGIDAVAFASKADEDKLDGDDGINLKYAKMVFVGVDIGLADGVEAEEYYFLTHTMSKYPVYQAGGNYSHMMCFNNLNCLNSKDDTDTIFILYTVDADPTIYQYPIWGGIDMKEPKKSKSYSHWVCGNMVRFNNSVTATLHVGNFTMPSTTFSLSDFGGKFSVCAPKDIKAKTDLIFNDIEYKLDAELIV